MPKGMLGKLPLARIQRLRDDLETKLAGNDGELWEAEAKKFLRKEPTWDFAKLSGKALAILGIVPNEPFAPTSDAFFRDGPNLYLGDDFKKLILARAKAWISKPRSGNLTCYELKKYARDSEIKTDLPKNHNFSLHEGLWHIARLLTFYGDGKTSLLMDDEYSNLFYFLIDSVEYTISLGRSIAGYWTLHAYLVNENSGWLAGHRVFSSGRS